MSKDEKNEMKQPDTETEEVSVNESASTDTSADESKVSEIDSKLQKQLDELNDKYLRLYAE